MRKYSSKHSFIGFPKKKKRSKPSENPLLSSFFLSKNSEISIGHVLFLVSGKGGGGRGGNCDGRHCLEWNGMENALLLYSQILNKRKLLPIITAQPVNEAMTTPNLPGFDFPRGTTRSPLIFPRIYWCRRISTCSPFFSQTKTLKYERSGLTFPRHATLIARPLTAFPKPTPGLLDQTRMTDAAVLGPIILLPRAVSANHAVGMFVRMVAVRVMALVAGEDFGAAAEAEPAVGFAVVGAAAVPGQGLARDDA